MTENENQIKDQRHKKLMKRLIQALVLSIAFNIVLFVFCLYEWQEVGYSILRAASFKPEKKKQTSLQEVANKNLEEELLVLKDKSIDELIPLLSDTRIVHDGYKVQDLALTTLCTDHFFNIQKPLASLPKQERAIRVEGKAYTLFPGLALDEFLQIERFAKEEKYPFTAEGLFHKLKNSPTDDGLKEVFTQTEEYLLVDTLLSRGAKISSDDVIELVLAGDFSTISQFVQEEKSHQDFSQDMRRKFLLSYVELNSKKAAELLVQTDFDYAQHKLDDSRVILMLSLLEDKPTLCKEYAIRLLESPRKEQIWNYAQQTLAHSLQKEELAKCTRQELLQYFGLKKPQEIVALQVEAARKNVTPKNVLPKAQAVTEKIQSKTQAQPNKKSQAIAVKSKKPAKVINYTVQTGDNLWKIAKKFKVEIHAIMLANNLKSDALKPGTILKIPM